MDPKISTGRAAVFNLKPEHTVKSAIPISKMYKQSLEYRLSFQSLKRSI